MTFVLSMPSHGDVRSTQRFVPLQRLPGIRRWSAVALVALVSGFMLPVHAQNVPPSTGSARSVNEWLTRMHEASRQRSYTGTLVVSAGAAMAASKIWHVCDGTQQMERVDTLTGAPRSTIRRNKEVITFVPEAKIAFVEKRDSLGMFPEMLRTPSNLIPQFYSAREVGVQRVAAHVLCVDT
eukprot:Opistho-1_new@51088